VLKFLSLEGNTGADSEVWFFSCKKAALKHIFQRMAVLSVILEFLSSKFFLFFFSFSSHFYLSHYGSYISLLRLFTPVSVSFDIRHQIGLLKWQLSFSIKYHKLYTHINRQIVWSVKSIAFFFKKRGAAWIHFCTSNCLVQVLQPQSQGKQRYNFWGAQFPTFGSKYRSWVWSWPLLNDFHFLRASASVRLFARLEYLMLKCNSTEAGGFPHRLTVNHWLEQINA
jgi:hypothetical protein